MRKTWILLAVAVLLLATPGLAVAKGGQGGASFNLYGEIKALDSDALTIGVLVESPASLAGDLITVQATGDTRFKECDEGTSYRIDFDDLKVGRDVRISGVVVGGTYVASRVIQYVPVDVP